MPTELENKISKYPVPVFRSEKGEPEILGSGFFVITQEDLVFITASHVFDLIKDNDSPMYVGVKDKILELENPNVFRLLDEHNADVDICYSIIPFAQIDFENICEIAIEWSEQAIDAKRVIEAKVLVQGYPLSKNESRKTIDWSKGLFNSYLYYEYFDWHITLSDNAYHQEICRSKFRKNNRIKLNGCSGGPVWLLSESDQSAYLLGVFIEYDSTTRIAKFVKIDSILERK